MPDSRNLIDRIHIEQLQIYTRVGVPENERAEPQRLLCSITLWPQRTTELGDKIANTVNYSAVTEMVRDLATRSEFRLIETLADKLAAHLLGQFDVSKVTVEIRKFVLPDTEFVSVTATQEAAEG